MISLIINVIFVNVTAYTQGNRILLEFPQMKIEAIDLFCGIGGLTCGLRKAKIDVVAGLDNDKTCKDAYVDNNDAEFICADISEYDFSEMKNKYSKDSIRVLVGCAPCQPFSSHTFKSKKEKDSRWNLISYFIDAIDALDPHVVSMENVRGITKTDVFLEFVEQLKKRRYKVDYDVLFCPDYGMPQSRSRLVLLASKLGDIKVPKPTHSKDSYVGAKEVIGALPPIKAGETCKKDPMHTAAGLTEINMKRMRASKPGGSWRDWDKSLLPNCYKRESGQSYVSVYGRMTWDNVSPTITTQFYNYGTGRFGHPEQDRALSLREGAMLQTFPRNYSFGRHVNVSTIARHIGNAVPPDLGKLIGKTIKKHVIEYAQ